MNVSEIDPLSHRTAGAADVDSRFLRRWSPRAMSGAPVSAKQLQVLFEAARWAPSCYNEQPWHFLYAHRDTAAWQAFYAALVEGNQSWATRAGVLIAVLSRVRFRRNDKPAPTHEFDTGAAWMALALQASAMGLVTHGMRGFNEAALRRSLEVPELYQINAVVAVGHPGDVELLSESERERETPSDRNEISSFVTEGRFPSPAP